MSPPREPNDPNNERGTVVGSWADDLSTADAEWQTLRDRQAHLTNELRIAESIRGTTSFRLGHAIVSAARRPWRIARVLRAARQRGVEEHLAPPQTVALRPNRSTTPSHPDRELLWSFRPEPPGVFDFLIGRSDGHRPSVVALTPHDAKAMLATARPRAVVIDASADEVGSSWHGLDSTSRPHLGEELSAVVDLCRRRDLPVVLWWTTSRAEAPWLERFASTIAVHIEDDESRSGRSFPHSVLDQLVPVTAPAPPPAPASADEGSTELSPSFGVDQTDSSGRRVLIAGHDLKFARDLVSRLDRDAGATVAIDQWPSLSQHDSARSLAGIEWADVILCEWCGQNAVWYSEHKRRDQRLIVRLHRFELDTDYVHSVNWSAVDVLVVVSEHFRQRALNEIPDIHADQVVMIHNGVDLARFDQAKSDDARFNVGMIGIAPQRKRLDRAVDIIERVRQHDSRFSLLTKGQLPWDHAWIWNRSSERSYFRNTFARIQSSPDLATSVAFDPHGPDVDTWLQVVGSVLSTSDDESFHMAPAEAMASGAVPIVWTWPAASSVYDDEWIVESTDAAATAILALADIDVWNERRARARESARRFDAEASGDRWIELLLGNNAA